MNLKNDAKRPRVGWNGGLGGWAGRHGHGFIDFAHFIHSAQ